MHNFKITRATVLSHAIDATSHKKCLGDTYAEIPHCFWALRFFLSFFRTSDNVRSFHVLFWSLQGLRGAFPSKRSEWPRNRKRNHPRPSFLETSHINKVKAPQHVKTPRSHRLPMYFPLISRSAFAQSKGSIKEINAYPFDLLVCLFLITFALAREGYRPNE